jgi:hypothetical protein
MERESLCEIFGGIERSVIIMSKSVPARHLSACGARQSGRINCHDFLARSGTIVKPRQEKEPTSVRCCTTSMHVCMQCGLRLEHVVSDFSSLVDFHISCRGICSSDHFLHNLNGM